ncbi:U3 small nucleolar RNA-associated protein 4 homolog isoform X2 [Manduca sexta]|uniref:U3 small nucleolar RNA-associated protein 4 homolog isoform X2 n=1 Tax=Manduca sexta TaxID=7130 RepID=UPI0018900D15|nr:U3 small nucleolar RNA-associated protein 4 homolog isoform X2 [Manduca sexta]
MASKIHRVRFYNPQPQAINCISFNKTSKHLALARDDASIEIWDLNYAPYLIKFIPGVKDGSVEALGWVHNRLLSTGLGGALIEWDLDKLCPKKTVLLTGSAAWCLDVNPRNTLAVVGTENGYINLYDVECDDIVYKKLFDKQEGRILCCKFNQEGNMLVTGSVNTIRVWNVETGQATARMSVSRRGKDVIVWALAVLSDNTVISGDSQGRLTFWDSTLGDQIESYITHKADISAIAVSEDEKSLYCSGVDPVITMFVKIEKINNEQSEVQWVKNVQRHIHEHDVRGLVLNQKQLISVGIDGYLTFSSFPPKWVMRIPHMLPAPRSSVCTSKKLLLLRYSNHLEVWKLGSYAVNNSGNAMISDTEHRNNDNYQDNNIEEDFATAGIETLNMTIKKQTLKVIDAPVKVVSVQTKRSQQIQCCELSPNGEFIVYSTSTDIRMLKLEMDEDQSNISLSKVIVSGVPVPCDRVAFSQDSQRMAAHSAGTIYVLQVDAEAGAAVIQTLSMEKQLKSKSILHLLLSDKTESGVTYLVVADSHGVIAVWTHSKKKYEHYVTLPNYHCVPSAITVDIEREHLIVTYVDQKIVEYGLKNKKFTDWPGSALPSEWLSRKSAVDSIILHPKGDSVIFQDATSLWIMDREMKYLAGFHWLDQQEAVSIEVLPENIVAQLPMIVITNKKRDK